MALPTLVLPTWMGSVWPQREDERREPIRSSSRHAVADVWLFWPLRSAGPSTEDAGVPEASCSCQGEERAPSHACESATGLETSMVVDSRVRVSTRRGSFPVGVAGPWWR